MCLKLFRFFVIVVVSKIFLIPAKHSKLEFDGILSPAVETDSVLLKDQCSFACGPTVPVEVGHAIVV